MKILFCIDATLDKTKTDETIYQELLSKQTDDYKKEQLEHALEDLKEEEKAFVLPKTLKVVKVISFFLSLIIFGGIISSIGDVTLTEAYDNAPYLFFISPVVFIIWLSIFLYEKNKSNRAAEDQILQNKNQMAITLAEDIFEDLNVPNSAIKMDVLGFKYMNREGKLKILPIGITTHINSEKRVYVENDTLYFADVDKVIAIPIHSIENIQKVKKRAVVPFWNKEIPYNRKPYKSYKIRVNQFGQFFIHYGIMNIKDNGVQYMLYLPDYEIDELKKMVDIQVNND